MSTTAIMILVAAGIVFGLIGWSLCASAGMADEARPTLRDQALDALGRLDDDD